MDNSYIFEIEMTLRKSLTQLDRTIKEDLQDLDRYRSYVHKKQNVEVKWAEKILVYQNAYEQLKFLINRSIMVDHERSACYQKLNGFKREVKTLNSHLRIMAMCKRLEVDAMVKIKTRQEVDKLCKQANDELLEDLDRLWLTGTLDLKINEKQVDLI
ncbi:hypothetical protein ACD591_05180 [Rufibacter glacialis]|uniref:Uncharacterized protein n=1 Tax=Rufibacter glacialis TaxID=1259555 RepID=A0A5M8QI20_9BACT|nr:hypothetical protein [Rufibacter glacialis]KAA6434741.1 hypothetical protein FOE74_11240 [Rufibacter glacialis]GGK72042.1 hypothetical protein GCM10011405_20340 [Rufibacter glacialis]